MIDLIRRGQTNVYGQVSDVKVQGLTATNIVKNGNFEDTSNWTPTASSLSVSNNVLLITGSGTSAYPRAIGETSVNCETDKVVWVRGKIKITNSSCGELRFRIQGSDGGSQLNIANQVTPTENQLYVFNAKLTLTDQIGAMQIYIEHRYADAETANGAVAEVQEVFAIDMTAAGLDTLTADEMNAKFPHWFDGTKSTNSVRVKSVGKNLFDKVNNKLESGTITLLGIEKVDATRCRSPKFIRVKPSTIYFVQVNLTGYSTVNIVEYDNNKAFVQRINVLNSSFTTSPNTHYIKVTARKLDDTSLTQQMLVDMSNATQLEYGTTATEYEPYKESIVNVNLPEPLRSLPNGVKDEVRVSGGKAEYIQRTKKKILQESDFSSNMVTSPTNVDILVTKINYLPDAITFDTTSSMLGVITIKDRKQITVSVRDNINNIGTFYVFEDQRIGFVVPKDTSLEQAKSLWTGLTLIYQLAEPIVTQLDPQPLTIFPNGTQYIEFGTKEVAEYADGINISNAEIPIKAMKTVDKLHIEDGHWKRTAIDLANVAVSPDGLSFTIADAVNGETYEYSYDYDSALSTLPDLEVGEPSLVTRNNRTIVL